MNKNYSNILQEQYSEEIKRRYVIGNKNNIYSGILCSSDHNLRKLFEFPFSGHYKCDMIDSKSKKVDNFVLHDTIHYNRETAEISYLDITKFFPFKKDIIFAYYADNLKNKHSYETIKKIELDAKVTGKKQIKKVISDFKSGGIDWHGKVPFTQDGHSLFKELISLEITNINFADINPYLINLYESNVAKSKDIALKNIQKKNLTAKIDEVKLQEILDKKHKFFMMGNTLFPVLYEPEELKQKNISYKDIFEMKDNILLLTGEIDCIYNFHKN